MYYHIPKKAKAKHDNRWQIGIYLGSCSDGSEVCIGVKNGNAWKTRSICEVAAEERWSRDAVQQVLATPANSGPRMTMKLALMTSRALRTRMTTPQGMLMLQSPLPLTLLMISTPRYSKGYASQRPTASSMVTQVVAQDVLNLRMERQIPKRRTTKSVGLACTDAMSKR